MAVRHGWSRSYRSTPVLQAFARRFYQSRHPGEDEEVTLPGAAGGGGNTPALVYHERPQDAIAWAAAEVLAGIRGGLRPQCFLIVHEDSRQLASLQAVVPESKILDHRDPAKGSVAITSLNAATGIERPIVLLLGLDRLFEKEGDPRLTEAEQQELVRDHTRKVYMAITRAGERLLISFRSERVRGILCGTS